MKILIVDDEQDSRRFLRKIAERACHQVVEAENGQEGLRLAAEEKPGLIISDALMPVMDGFYFLREVKKNPALKDIPFVFYSATYTEQDDVKLAMSMGADDYIVKPKEPDELWAEVGRALEKRKKENRTNPDFSNPAEENEYLRQHTQIMALKLEQTVAKLRDSLVTQKQSEYALRKKTEELEKFFSVALDLLCIADADGNLKLLNPAWERILGYTREELTGAKFFEFLHPDDIIPTKGAVATLAAQKEVKNFVNRYRCKDGTYRWLEWRSVPAGNLIYAAARDITQQRQAMQDHEVMASRSYQAQKMEAMGRLAGGVAHDFNNLLTAIEGYSDILLKTMPPGDVKRTDIREIKKAAERAASLTRQLLAFSRKQTVTPQTLDLNGIIRNLEKILHRLIGENFEIAFLLDPGLKKVKVDPSQLEQVIINLMLNSRDSMPKGGKLIFETHNVRIDAETVSCGEAIALGEYSQMVITDTGLGMDAETQSHIFEPFFTTKGADKGTGLGLAMVFGIVKQAKGYIFVYSEVGLGTTIKIYLPVSEQETTAERSADAVPEDLRGSETILVAEDETIVRDIICRILRESGYKVIEAHDGEEALRILAGNKAPIHAAIVDLVMPKINGKELCDLLKFSHPETKPIYTSGYTDEFIKERIGIDLAVPLLQKPVSAVTLLRQVRKVIGPG